MLPEHRGWPRRPNRLFHRFGHQQEGVIGIAAEGGNLQVIFALKCRLVGCHDTLLRIAIGQNVGDQQCRPRQPHALCRVSSGQLDEAVGGNAVALIEWQFDTELGLVAGDDRRALTKAGIKIACTPSVLEILVNCGVMSASCGP